MELAFDRAGRVPSLKPTLYNRDVLSAESSPGAAAGILDWRSLEIRRTPSLPDAGEFAALLDAGERGLSGRSRRATVQSAFGTIVHSLPPDSALELIEAILKQLSEGNT